MGKIEREFAISEACQSARCRLSYATTNTRPDLSFHDALIAQVIPENVTEANFKMLSHSIRKQKKLKNLVLPKLHLPSIHIVG